MKHPQTIAGVQTIPFVELLNLKNGFNDVFEDDFLKAVGDCLVWRRREELDNKENIASTIYADVRAYLELHGYGDVELASLPLPSYKGDRTVLQLLPYIVFRIGGEIIAVYQRGKGVGESRLAGNNSIGYGGHIDFMDALTVADEKLQRELDGAESDEDVEAVMQGSADVDEAEFSTVDVAATLETSLRREIEQEVVDGTTLLDSVDLKFFGLLYDRSNDVGMLHLGIVYIADLPAGTVIAPKEAELLAMPGATVDALPNYSNLESWSEIVARELARGEETLA